MQAADACVAVRAWLPVLILLLSGCAQPATEAGPPEPTPQDPQEPAPAVAPVLPLYDGTLAASAPGGAGRVDFEAPASGYVELFVNTNGTVRAVGDLLVVFVAPDGTETVYAEGSFAQDDAAGLAVPEASRSDWRLRIPVQGGNWTIEWSVDGEMSLPLFVEAL